MNTEKKPSSLKCFRVKTLDSENQVKSPMLKTNNTNRARLNTLESISPIKNYVRKYTQNDFQIPLYRAKLSPIKLYETKLKLSAQSWIMYDMKNNKYKRGWKHSKTQLFNGLLRIVVLMCYCLLIQSDQNMKQLKIRVNQTTLRQKRLKLSKKQQKRLSWLVKKKKLGLSNNTIINLYDIICGLVLTDYEDLLDYSLIYCGYLLQCQQQDTNMPQKEEYHFIQSNEQSQNYIQIFMNYCNFKLFPNILNLNNTKLISDFDLQSTCSDMCSIFLAGLQNSYFEKIAQMRYLESQIRHQVGFKFWEDRTIKFSNNQKQDYDNYFCHLVYKGQNNFEAISYNKKLKIFMIVENSKFSMADLDIKVLQNWFKTVSKSLVSYPPQQNTNKVDQSPKKSSPKKSIIFPLLRITDK